MRNFKKALSAYDYEIKSWENNATICGIDEAGRGAFAGPVVVCAAVLHPHVHHPLLTDSKLLSAKELQDVYTWLQHNCQYVIILKNSIQVDQHNVYQATLQAFRQAALTILYKQKKQVEAIIADAMPVSLTGTQYRDITIMSMPKAELASASVAAASILAKVTRDSIMKQMHKSFPVFNFAQHKGYGTKAHHEALYSFQPSIMHRKTYLKNIYKEKSAHGFCQQTLC